jgi:hypothetical protein
MGNTRRCCLYSRSPARQTKRPTCEATEGADGRRAAGWRNSGGAGWARVRAGAMAATMQVLTIIAGMRMRVARRDEGDYDR